MTASGYVKAHRSALDHPAFRDAGEAMAFVWMTMRASWKPVVVRYKGHQISLERGQLCVSIRDFGNGFGRSKDWANRFLQRLADRDMIATATATGCTVVTICNYDKYQTLDDVPATPPARKPRQHRDSTATQNNEGNEVNEGSTIDKSMVGASASKAKYHRLPANWKPDRFKEGTGARDAVDRRGAAWAKVKLEDFHDWAANAVDKPGIGQKLDWQAAFRKWITKQDSEEPNHGNDRQRSTPSHDDLRGSRPDPALDMRRIALAEIEAEERAAEDQAAHQRSWLALPSEREGGS